MCIAACRLASCTCNISGFAFACFIWAFSSKTGEHGSRTFGITHPLRPFGNPNSIFMIQVGHRRWPLNSLATFSTILQIVSFTCECRTDLDHYSCRLDLGSVLSSTRLSGFRARLWLPIIIKLGAPGSAIIITIF